MTIQQHYGRKDVAFYKSKHGVAIGLPLPSWFVGLELEIEGWKDSFEQKFGGFSFTTDGSLRSTEDGFGIEAITKPVAIEHVPPMLKAFFTHFGITDANYSERCSTHIHFNVEPLEFDQLASICLVYQTVEQLLFDFVGHDRDTNIFCVPWNQCNLSYNIVNQIEKNGHDTFRRWQKYSALNLKPVVDQGTIEFRHLHGTCDVDLITNWMCLLAKIIEYGQNTNLDEVKKSILNMNTISNYHQWLHSVFGEYVGLLQRGGFETVLAKGVIDSKLMISPPSKKKSVYDDVVNYILDESPEALAQAVDPVARIRENARGLNLRVNTVVADRIIDDYAARLDERFAVGEPVVAVQQPRQAPPRPPVPRPLGEARFEEWNQYFRQQVQAHPLPDNEVEF